MVYALDRPLRVLGSPPNFVCLLYSRVLSIVRVLAPSDNFNPKNYGILPGGGEVGLDGIPLYGDALKGKVVLYVKNHEI